MYKIKSNMLVEIILRLSLWWLFIWLEQTEPFIREIQENELWKYKYPVTSSYLTASTLWMLIFVTPSVLFLAEYALTKKKDDLTDALLGITLSYCLTGVTTSYVKMLVGRPRPDFYFRCFPSGQGTDLKNCDGNRKSYMDGRKSFPSGHSSFVFSCMVFVSIYMARKFQLFEQNRKKSWLLCICILPLVVAASVAISRTCDYHHHYEDVIAGGLLGTVISCVCYRLYFPL